MHRHLHVALPFVVMMALGCNTAEPTVTSPPAGNGVSQPMTPPAPGTMTACTGAEKLDFVRVENARVEGDTLHLSVTSGGGCAPHDFGVCWKAGFLESDPPAVAAVVTHDAHGDTCEAIISREVAVDLTPLKAAYRERNPNATGPVDIQLGGTSVRYGF